VSEPVATSTAVRDATTAIEVKAAHRAGQEWASLGGSREELVDAVVHFILVGEWLEIPNIKVVPDPSASTARRGVHQA
jgi:hypothetical protein